MKIHFPGVSDTSFFPARPGCASLIGFTLTTLLLLVILLMVPGLARSEVRSAGSDKDDRQDGPVVSNKCAELTSRLDIDLKEVVRAGCEPSPAQLSKLMDNPVGNLVFVENEFDWIQIKGSAFEGAKDAYVYRLIPTFPLSLGDSWNLINRPIFQGVSVPLKKSVGQLIGMSPNEIVQSAELFSTIRDPFGRTTGFGDITYIGLFSPKKPYKIKDGIFVSGPRPDPDLPDGKRRRPGPGQVPGGTGGSCRLYREGLGARPLPATLVVLCR